MSNLNDNQHQWTIPTTSLQIEDTTTINNTSLNIILSSNDAENIIENQLKKFNLYNIGNGNYLKQHHLLSKLNLQAHYNAASNSDAFVLEGFLTFDKLDILLHELLLIEIWKEKIFPKLLNNLIENNLTMRTYFILYTEAIIINLLEIFLFHSHAVEALGDHVIDMIDYCARNISYLNAGIYTRNLSTTHQTKEEILKEVDNMVNSPSRELLKQKEDIDFRISVTSVSICRFLCEHISVLALSAMTRILDTHDILLSLVPLIENPPWTRRKDNGEWEKLIDFQWKKVEPQDLLTLTKNEGQVWLTLFHLIANDDCRKNYQLNTFRKDTLLRVRKYLNDFLLDQLPILADIQRYMDELSLVNVPESSSLQSGGGILLMEQVAELREAIIKDENNQERNWDEIANHQMNELFSNLSDINDKDLLLLANIYTNDTIDDLTNHVEFT